jgi:uncharacterized protein (DUF2147 family)
MKPDNKHPRTNIRALGLAAVLLVAVAAPVLAADPVGEWFVEDRNARVRIASCPGQRNALCGNIVWSRYAAGTDQHNPDPSKRDRPIVGTMILIDTKQTAPNRWEGRVHSPQDGSSYQARMALKSDDVLRMEGCVLGGIFCGGQDWTHYQAQPTTQGSAPSRANAPKR